MSTKILSGVTAIGCGNAIHTKGLTNHTFEVRFKSLAATKISALSVIVQGSATGEDSYTGVITNTTLAIGSTATEVANGTFYYRIAGVNYTLAANAGGSPFTAAHVIGDGASALWGCINIYVNAAGTIVTKVPISPQVYATAALAHAAADTIVTTSDLCYIGRILINSDTTTWTANTDDMTNGSDLTTATFLSETSSFMSLFTYPFSLEEITEQKAKFILNNIGDNYMRLFVSALTGTGSIDGYISSKEE